MGTYNLADQTFAADSRSSNLSSHEAGKIGYAIRICGEIAKTEGLTDEVTIPVLITMPRLFPLTRKTAIPITFDLKGELARGSSELFKPADPWATLPLVGFVKRPPPSFPLSARWGNQARAQTPNH